MATYATSTPRQDEAGNQPEELVTWACNALYAAGIRPQVTTIRRVIREANRRGGPDAARVAVKSFLDSAFDRSWTGFELFVNGHADPTGAHAARNVDLERGGAR